jgi:hypothetical protein
MTRNLIMVWAMLLLLALPGFSQPVRCQLFQGNRIASPTRDGFLVRVYRFTFATAEYCGVFTIDQEHLNHLAQYGQAQRSNLATMVAIAAIEAQPIAEEIRRLGRREGWTRERQAQFALALVQALPYATDEESMGLLEHFRLPSETLADTDIDCEDSSILLAGVLSGLGVSYVMLNPPGHIAIGVDGGFRGWHAPIAGRKFYFAETTGSGFVIGQVPGGLRKSIQVLDVSGEYMRAYGVKLASDGEPLRMPAREAVDSRRALQGRAPTVATTVYDLNWLVWVVVLLLVVGVVVVLLSLQHGTQRRLPRETPPDPYMTQDEVDDEDFRRNTSDI